MNFLLSSFTSLFPTRNPKFVSNVLRWSNTQLFDSRNFNFVSFSRSTHKPFDEIPQRNVFVLKSKLRISHIASRENYVELKVPNYVFGDVFSCTATISRLVRSNRQKEAIGLFKLMLTHDCRPNYVTILGVIRALGAIDVEEMAWVIHGFVIKLGFDSQVSVVTALLGLYSLYNIAIVWKLFDHVHTKDVVLWSAMVVACSKNCQFIEAFDVFREMQCFGVEPNHVSIVSVLPICADFGALLFGKQIHGYSIKKDFSSIINIQNSLVDMYVKCKNLKSSILVFEGIENKDLVSWNTLICGCTENGCPRKTLDLFCKMRYSCFKPDETTFRNALGACSQAKELKFGLELHCDILKAGLLASISIVTTLLRIYADFGDLGSAQILFGQLHCKDFIVWSAMISVYARAGHPYLALDTFKQMQLAEEKPNEITLVSLLQACSLIDTHEVGKSIHAHVIRARYSSNPFITSALIDLYCKFGRLSQGKILFDQLPTKDLICWSSMINGYGMNGCGTEALDTFADMLDCGTKPNDVVFLSVLSACSHCGLEEEGWRWFSCMEEKFGISPTLAHCACIVDMLSRRGQIEEALGFINTMSVEPDASVWGALLAGCRATQGAIEVAEFAAKRLFSLDPENTSYYVILSNLYAEHGRWRDVERLRMLVKEKGLRKIAGYSMVEAM